MKYGTIVLVAAALLAGAHARAQVSDRVYSVGEDGATMPRVLKEVKPRYPSAAREAGKSAVVILDCVVTREGRPSRVRVRTGGGAAFDRAAMTALRQWRFEPGLRDGRPVPVRLEIELTFTAK